MARIFNFSAGPSTLPLPVLEKVRDEFVDFQGKGMSLVEMSHRGKVYEEVHNQAVALFQELLGLPANYKVMFLGGGATLQFGMVPMNFLWGGKSCDFTVTGTWAKKACDDAKKVGKRQRAVRRQGRQLPEPARPEEPEGHAGRGLPAPDLERDHRRGAVAGLARDRRRAAVLRHVLRLHEPAHPGGEVLADLRRGAEERRPGRLRRGHPARGAAGALPAEHRRLPGLPRARQGELALQHAAGVRHLDDQADHGVAEGPGRPAGRGEAGRAALGDHLRRHRALRRATTTARCRRPRARR